MLLSEGNMAKKSLTGECYGINVEERISGNYLAVLLIVTEKTGA